MPIRLRLAVAFALAAAALFALGGWLFASGLSSAQLKTIDSQLAAQLAQAGRYSRSPRRRLPDAGHRPGRPCPEREHRRRKRSPLVTASQLSQARQGRIWLTRTVDEESTRMRRRAARRPPGVGRGRGRIARDVRRHPEPGGARARHRRGRLHRRRGPGRLLAGARRPLPGGAAAAAGGRDIRARRGAGRRGHSRRGAAHPGRGCRPGRHDERPARPGCSGRWPGSAPSSPTPATSCAIRSRCCGANSSSRRGPAAAFPS